MVQQTKHYPSFHYFMSSCSENWTYKPQVTKPKTMYDRVLTDSEDCPTSVIEPLGINSSNSNLIGQSSQKQCRKAATFSTVINRIMPQCTDNPQCVCVCADCPLAGYRKTTISNHNYIHGDLTLGAAIMQIDNHQKPKPLLDRRTPTRRPEEPVTEAAAMLRTYI